MAGILLLLSTQLFLQAGTGMILLLSNQLFLQAGAAQIWDLDLCKTRESHWTHNKHGYLYSGKSSLLASEEVSIDRVAVEILNTSDAEADYSDRAKEANLTAVTRDWAKAGDWCQ